MWLVKGNIAMSCLPKVGSQSMRHCIPGQRLVSNEEVLKIPVRVGWVKNPLMREQSGYSFFHFLNKRDMNGRRTPNKEQTSSWEVFVDHFLSTPNKHWDSQTQMLTLDGKYVPTVTHRFEDIMELWETYIPGLLPWLNACSKLPINDYRKDDIEQFNREDDRKWLLASLT